VPQASEWTPEDGDSEWWPDPDREVESYTDQELRFTPAYRLVTSILGEHASDPEKLEACRDMIRGYLADDGTEPEPEPETVPQLRILV
jgi:hypothetical protein